MAKTIQRRQFLKSAVAAGAGLLILPHRTVFGAESANNKLNIALIGAHGRATAHYNGLAAHNVVAICDVDEDHLGLAAKKFPKAKKYVDWRKCIDQKKLDAVVCCTTDHTHAFVTNWAINRDLHIYCEKPLGNCVEEVRVVRANFQKHKDKIASQVGTQRHEYPNFNRVREMITDGVIGELKTVYAWGNRQLRRPGYLPAEGKPPKSLHYDLWIGPSPMHPYNPGYFSGQTGANCLQWNMYWDFGSGQVGDMGSHTMDLAWNALDGGLPTAVESESEEAFNPEVTPVALKSTYHLPANAWRPAVPVIWFQGGPMPSSPDDCIDLNKIDHGVMFKGEKGFLIADFENRILLPYGKDTDMTYYNKRSADKVLPDMNGFQQEWFDACKGDVHKTSCNIPYNSDMAEMMLLGHVAYRAGAKIEYDGAAGRVTNNPEADKLLRREYRKGWTLDG
jgi:predicted dehydrogenase